jgi:hypothetical protein
VIIETKHFEELHNHLSNTTLVVLDIDDTLIVPIQTLGRDVWFQWRLNSLLAQGLPKDSALDRALAEWEAVRHLTTMRLVEEGTPAIIQCLQSKGIAVMGLTTQGLALATRTIKQLEALNIQLNKNAPSVEDHYFINQIGVLYRQGILFTSGTPKGEALLKLLAKIGYRPNHILFVNDKITHLRDVEGAVIAAGLQFTGLRYGYSDSYVEAFSPDIAEVQWCHSTFDSILSDEDACLHRQNSAAATANAEECVAVGG